MSAARKTLFVQRERGAALLAALCFATVLAVSLGSYITMCYRTLELSSRSVQNASSVALAEMGMEDALWALNKNDWSGWTITGTTASKTLSGISLDGGLTGTVALTITSYNGTAGTRTVTAKGTATLANGSTISRTLTATSARAPLFVNAVAATTGTVRFTAAGTSSVIDSYNSALGAYGGQTATYSAILSAGSTSTSAATVQLTNAQVKGYVATLNTGPSYGTSALLKGPSTPDTTKIDNNRISTSPYQPLFEIRTVTGAGTTLANPPLDSTTVLGTAGATSPAIYYSTGLDLRGTTRLRVEGPVRLVVNGQFYIGLYGGSPQIELTPDGSLEVFASGDIAIYGNGIKNRSRAPERLAIYGTSTLTVPDMNTNENFHGVIYTPNGDYTVASNNEIHGAIVARNVTFSGTAPAVHYDLNLRNTVFSGLDTPFAVSDWRETTTEQ